jgi:hypothetical protein
MLEAATLMEAHFIVTKTNFKDFIRCVDQSVQLVHFPHHKSPAAWHPKHKRVSLQLSQTGCFTLSNRDPAKTPQIDQ